MKKILKKAFCLSLAAALTMVSLAGCQGNTKSTAGSTEWVSETSTNLSTASDTKAMGRYLEEDLVLPEGVSRVMAITKQTDGSILIATINDSLNRELWTSSDAGVNWTKKSDFPKEIQSEETSYLYKTALSSAGELACIVYSPEGDMSYVYVDKEGTLNNLDIPLNEPGPAQDQSTEKTTSGSTEGTVDRDSEQNDTEQVDSQQSASANREMLSAMQFDETGALLAQGFNGVYKIDTATGDITQRFASGEYLIGYGITGNTLLVVTKSEIKLFDLTTGKPMDRDKVLESQLNEKNIFESMNNSSESDPIIFQKGQDEQSLYFCDSSGLYHHTIGGTISEQLIDGTLNSLGSPSIGLQSLVPLDDNSFLVLCIENNKNRILRYTYSKDTPTVPDTELRVYALEDNDEVRQSIALFQKENPDISVTMEVGMSGEDAETYSDALRTLNTNIMAGNGPDLLVLDGMPIPTYIEKGILTDLGGILAPTASSDGFLENIKNTYENEGKVYALPTRFKVPAFQSDSASVAAIKDLKSLADQAELLSKEKPNTKAVVNMVSVSLIVGQLYNICSPAWLKEDGSLDKDALTEFFTQIKRLYSIDDHSQDFKQGSSLPDNLFSDISAGCLDIMTESALINIGQISSIDDLEVLEACTTQNSDITYNLLNGQAEKLYIPETIIGISSKSTLLDEAGKFASFMISLESQSKSQGGGFPVNKAAFNTILGDKPADAVLGSVGSTNTQTGENVILELEWPSDEARNKFKGYVDSLNTAPLMDSMIRQTVIEQAEKFLKSESSIDDTVNSILQKVDLYLLE